jgi:transposase
MISQEAFMEVLALHRLGHSQRYIARKLGIHRATVKRYLKDPALPQYSKQESQASILEPYHLMIRDYLEEDDYQATWIFDRLKNAGFQGGYDTVKNYVRGVKERLTRLAYIRFETEPGLQAQVDWGDFQVQNPDGSTSTLYVFAMVLGFSRALYVEFVPRCTLETFLDCHIRAFKYLGGVPAEILYDNMKNVVIGREDGRPVYNVEFLHFASHYGFTPRLCPPYSPWVKGKVERPMHYLRERFWRGYRFGSLEKTNRDVLRWLQETANRRLHGTHKQPVNLRWEQERPSLGTLPPTDFDTSVKVFRKVYRDCQISYNTNRYRIPHHMVGKKVMLKIKDGGIRIYDDEELLVTYAEAEGRHQYIGHPFFYEQLMQDRKLRKRKYGRSKGKATRGLTTSSLFVQVEHRPLAEYEKMAAAGGA